MFESQCEKVLPTPSISPVSTIQVGVVRQADKSASSDLASGDLVQPKKIVSVQTKITVACQAFVMFIVSIDSTILTTTLPVCADTDEAI